MYHSLYLFDFSNITISFMPPNVWIFNWIYLKACHSWASSFMMTSFSRLRFALHRSPLLRIFRNYIKIDLRLIYSIYIILSLLDTFKPIRGWLSLLDKYIILKKPIFRPLSFHPKNTYLLVNLYLSHSVVPFSISLNKQIHHSKPFHLFLISCR